MSAEDKESENLLNLFDDAFSGEGIDESPLFSSLQNLSERYSQEEFLIAGGMKRIFKVFDTRAERFVALAKLHENAPKNHYDSFIREARLTAKLVHPNIMTVHDIGIINDTEPYFTMELKNGGSLEDILAERKERNSEYLQSFSRNDLLEVFLKICDAIAFAHFKEVIHLDLKPANIQIGNFGEVLVCDWGLGKIIGDAEDTLDSALFDSDMLNDMTLAGHIKGTPGYMAPEQIDADLAKNKQTDIYSLGCILYSVLTDEIPISGSTEEKINKTKAGQISKADERFPNKEIPKALSAVAYKAMNINASERYQSVQELSSEVQKHLSGYATEAEDAGFLKQAQLFWQRHKAICNLTIVSLTLIIGLSFFFILQLTKSRDEAIIAKKDADEALALYKEEKKSLTQARKQWSDDLEQSTDAFRYQLFFHDPKRFIKQAIDGLQKSVQLDPGNKLAHGLIGHQYFMIQNFHKANAIFAEEPFDQEDLVPISQKFSKMKENDNKLLSIEDFNVLLSEITYTRRRYYLSERMIEWDQRNRLKKADYTESVKTVLNAVNGFKHYEFKLEKKTQFLTLKGQNLTQLKLPDSFGSAKSLLRYLPLKSLKLVNTQVMDPDQLAGLHSLEKLDLSQNKMRNLKDLENLSSLKELIVAEGQYTKREQNKIPASINVTILGSPTARR
ncbi:MAG: protein kinase [Lentisphaerales bacterium]|nr:protein kinase [Lentisphaerales bacterium]